MNVLLSILLLFIVIALPANSQLCKEITNVTSITCRSPFTPYANFSIPLDTGECSAATLGIATLNRQFHVINKDNPWVALTAVAWNNVYVKYVSFWWWGSNGTTVAPDNTFIPLATITSKNTGQPLQLGMKNNMPCISTARCFHLSTELTDRQPHHFLLIWSTTTASAGNFRVYKDGYLAYVTSSTTASLAPLIGNTPYETTAIATAQYEYSQVFDLRIYTAPRNPATMVTFLQTEIDAAKLYGCGPSRGYGFGCTVSSPVVTSSVYPQLDYKYIGYPNYEAQGANKYDLYINRHIRAGNGFTLPGFSILSSINTYPSRFIMSFAVRRTMGLAASGAVTPLVLWFRASPIQGMLAVADYRPSATQTNIIVSPFTSMSSTSCAVTWRRTNTNNLIDTTKWEMYHVLVNLSAASTWNIWQSGPGGNFGTGGAWGATTFPTSLGSVTYNSANYPGIDGNGLWVHSSVAFISIHPIPSSNVFIPNPLNFLPDLYKATTGGVSASSSWYPPIGPVISTALTTAGYFRPPFACDGRCTLYISSYNTSQTRAVIIPNSNREDGISKVCHGTHYNNTNGCQTTCPANYFLSTYQLCVTNQPCLCDSPRILALDGLSCQCLDETTQYGSQCLNCACESPATCNSGVQGNGTCSCPPPLVLRADGNGCECPDETTQYGPNCTACDCLFPAWCDVGFRGNGSCHCPSPTVLQFDNKTCDCPSITTEYTLACIDCGCRDSAFCDGGIWGTNECLCPPGQHIDICSMNTTCECDFPEFHYGIYCDRCNCTGTAMCNSTIHGDGRCICPGNQVYDPEEGCKCPLENQYSESCLNCTCNNHPQQICNKLTGACECKNGLYSYNNTCHCHEGFYYDYTVNACKEVYSQTYPTNCDYLDTSKIDCQPPFTYYTGYDTDFHVDGCNMSTITPFGTLAHYRKNIKYTTNVLTSPTNAAVVEDPLGTTIFFNSTTYISYISFWWKGVSLNGSNTIVHDASFYPLFTIGSNVETAGGSFTVFMYRGFPCIRSPSTASGPGNCPGSLYTVENTVENIWKKFDITWVKDTHCFRLYANGSPVFASSPFTDGGANPYFFCQSGSSTLFPSPYNNPAGSNAAQKMYYPISMGSVSKSTELWQLQDLYIFTDTMTLLNGYPNSNYNTTYMDTLVAKAFHCGPRYGFGSGCRLNTNSSSYRISPIYQYQSMSSLAGTTLQELNGVKRYLLYADSFFVNDNIHLDSYNSLINYFNANNNNELELTISFKIKMMLMGTFNSVLPPGIPLVMFRTPTNRKIISLFFYNQYIVACTSLYTSATDTITLSSNDNNCYLLYNASTGFYYYPPGYTQFYARIVFSNNGITVNNTYVSYRSSIPNWMSVGGSASISSMNVTAFDKNRVATSGLYVSPWIKDLYWYLPNTTDIATRNMSKFIDPFVYDTKLNGVASLVNSSYVNWNYSYPLGGRLLYNSTTLNGYLTGPYPCLGNCVAYTKLSSGALFVSMGNTTSSPQKTCNTEYSSIDVGCQSRCISGDSRPSDGLCLTGTNCYCPYGFLQADGRTCECGNKWGEYGLNCQKCACDNTTAICNSGLRGNGACNCVNPPAMYNYTYIDPNTYLPVTSCQCTDFYYAYGPYCNRTCTPYIQPAYCSTGVTGTGFLTCPEQTKQIEVLVDGVSYCECKEPSKQYGSSCLGCMCDYPATCKGGITGDGSCSCPSYTYAVINPINGRMSCECLDPDSYGPFCTPCNCSLGANCNSGINGTGACYCREPGYTLNENGNACNCPANYYGVITYDPNSYNIGLCNPCSICPYGTTCDQGRTGNGSCITLPGYKCTNFCGTQYAEINCADPLAYGMDCTGRCPDCNYGSTCLNGTTGTGVCRKLPGFACVANCDKPNGIYDCVDPTAYGSNCEFSCDTSNCKYGTRCDSGYRGNGTCLVLPEFALVAGTEADPVYDCADPNRWGSTCTNFCPSSCPYGSRCSNGTMGTGQCIAIPNFEYKSPNYFDCVEGKYGLGCIQDCPVCPAGSYCPSGFGSQGGCLPLPFYRKINDTVFDCLPDRFGYMCLNMCPMCNDAYGYCDSGVLGTGTCLCKSPTIQKQDGSCDCPPGQSGAGCLLTCPSCDANSTCFSGLNGNNQCVCNGNLTRLTTTSPCDCPSGYYGSHCQYACGACFGGSFCQAGINGTGNCVCPTGQHFVNGNCECDAGRWGSNCQYTCPNCTMYDSRMFCSDGRNGTGSCFCTGSDNLVLYQATIFTAPKCQCNTGWMGDECLTPAPVQCAPFYKYYYYPNNTYYCDCFEGIYNTSCNALCPPCASIDVNSECDYGMKGTGTCKCKQGYIKNEYNRCVCPPNKYGVDCLQTCKPCNDPSGYAVCNDGESGDGSCICPLSGMNPTYNSTGSFLGCTCKPGFFGPSCTSYCYENCPSRDGNSICNDGMSGNGLCKCTGHSYLTNLVGAIATCECLPGYYGPLCNNTCNANYTMYDPNAYCLDGTKGNGSLACGYPYVIQSYFPIRCGCPQNRSGINCDIVDQVCTDTNAYVNSGMYGDGKCYCKANTITQANNGTSAVSCVCPSNKFGSTCSGTCPPCRTYHPDMYCLEGLQGTGICVCNSTKLLTLNYSSVTLTGTPSCQCQSGYGGTPCTLLPPPPPCPVNQRVLLHSNGSYYCECEQNRYGPNCEFVCTRQIIDKSICLDGKNGTGQYVCQPNTVLSSKIDVENGQMIPVCVCDTNWYGLNCDKFCNVTSCTSDSFKYCDRDTGQCLCNFPTIPYKGSCECSDLFQGYDVYGPACDSCWDHYYDPGYPNPHVTCNSGAAGNGLITCDDPSRFRLVQNTTTRFFSCVCKDEFHWGPDCLPCPVCNATDSRATCNTQNGFCQCPPTHYLRVNMSTNEIYCECPHGYTGDQCQLKIIVPVEPCPYPNQIKVANLTDGSLYCTCMDGYMGDTCSIRKPADACLENQIRVVNITDNTSSCQCKYGYTGQYCEIFILPEPCGMNQIRLVNMSTGDTYCACIDGYTGTNCSEKVLLPACSENAIRVYNISTGGSECICLYGWQGVNCTERITVPSCGINQIRIVINFTDGTSQCACMEGWTGSNCTERIPIPACGTNQIRLVNLTTGYTYCACTFGWQGVNCTERIPIPSCGTNAIRVINTIDGSSSCQCIYGREGFNCLAAVTPPPCDYPNQIRIIDPNDVRNSYCICSELFTGSTCEIFKGDVFCPNTSYTILDPETQDIRCACKPGWGGMACSQNLNYNPCPIPDRQLLILDPVTKVAQCRCNSDWKGVNCSFPYTFIECEANQVAVVNEVTFRLQCQCKPGWGGPDCLDKVLPPVCPSNYVLSANYTTGELFCKCASSQTGDNCEIYVPSVSCPGDNSVTVLDSATGELSCACKSLWSGPNCTVPAVSSLCPVHANAVVSPTNSSIYCECMTGYTGTLCEEKIVVNETIPIPVCSSNQFLHYDPTTSRLTCVCLFGYSGEGCNSIYTLPVCSEFQNLVFNISSSEFYCSCINGTYGTFCNETIYKLVEIVVESNTTNSNTSTSTSSDIFGISSLGTAGQVAAFAAYTVGVGGLATGTYIFFARGAVQLLVGKDTENEEGEDERKEDNKQKTNINKKKRKMETAKKNKEEKIPLIKPRTDLETRLGYRIGD